MKTISTSAPDATSHALAEEAREVRDFIASNRSETLLRLFDFLLRQSVEGRRPKETEIAVEVFPGGPAASGIQGSQVRVGIYRLRKKLDLYYADKPGKRLVIPQGEYGFVLKLPDASSHNEKAPAEEGRMRPRHGHAARVAAAILLLANIALLWLLFRGALGFGGPADQPAFWRSFEGKTTAIAMGDYFMFISKPNDKGVEEVIQDPSIDSADTFYEYVTKTASERGSLRNEDLYAVSSDIVGSISRLWSYLKDYRLIAVASSALDPNMMKTSNIVYVGALDALNPLLKSPLFRASQFNCATTCYELVDRPSGRQFLSDSPYLLDDGIIPRRDYGYIAGFPGPSGNQVLIVSGTGDAGVTQMAGIVTDANKLEELRQRVGGNLRSFEALYQVRTMFSQSYGNLLLIARPINSDRIWETSVNNGSVP
ncbi:hypothetical protein [Nitrospirillum viridazoti]|nr:hypothetical protein [Nitrospirillum amazonense]